MWLFSIEVELEVSKLKEFFNHSNNQVRWQFTSIFMNLIPLLNYINLIKSYATNNKWQKKIHTFYFNLKYSRSFKDDIEKNCFDDDFMINKSIYI